MKATIIDTTQCRPENANFHGENTSPLVNSSSQAQYAENIGLGGQNTIFQTGSTSRLHPATGQETKDVGWNRRSLDPCQLLRNPSGLSSRSSFDEHYEESAVHGLLALGHSTMETHPTEDTNVSASVHQASRLSLNPTAAACMSPAVSSGNLVSVQDANSEQVLELLKHFRYEIAPWLDIYDMSHSFGILVSRMAMASRELLYALLALSAYSLASLDSSPSTLVADANKYVDISESYRNIEKATNNLHRPVAAVLRVVYHLSSRLSDTWMNKIDEEMESLSTVSTNPWEPVLMDAIYSLLLRIDISSALTNNTTLRVPIPAHLHTPTAAMQSNLDVVFRHSQYILILCAQAVQLQSGTLETESPLQLSRPEKFVERWKMLVASLGDWYNNRPQGFWPILELSSTPEMADTVNSFPVILFTNSAAVFANQMLHTAMCLLLDRKPRTLKSIDNRNVMMSPLWNAHRICGIALNNDRRECWDPSLVASLFVAARKMTHESQQKDIEQGFFRIQELTGWDMHDPLAKLHETWRLADGN
ncbi:transcriptional regulator family: Fungal Specific TF [Paecilomyces variotii]|nr:transcriptional regulator family: Fungal Specific TF [Paecilomyces variotii]